MDKRMEKDKDLRTLECLRGRLIAERQVSKIAKEDSERMSNKLVELENMLKQEIKMRNKAEKKLKSLKKKLESLNISSVLVEYLEQSSSSEKSEEASFMSFTTSACVSEENESDFNDVPNSVTISSQQHENNHHITFSSSSSNSPDDFSENPSPKSSQVCSKTSSDIGDYDNNSSTELRSSMQKDDESDDHEIEDCVDNSLAIVPVNLPECNSDSDPKIKTIELKPAHENIAQVLDSLRYIREKIQNSMEMRQMVRVGPI